MAAGHAMVDLLLRAVIWMSAAGWAVAEWFRLTGPAPSTRARLPWTLGAGLAGIHVAVALHFRHGWSQASAWDETARQTRDLLGFEVGWGLVVNYLFLAVWAGDAAWWWLRPAGYAARSPALDTAVRFFLLFIITNGTIVFGQGPVRVFGALLLGALAARWLRQRRAPTATA